jgi:hypothetical protein
VRRTIYTPNERPHARFGEADAAKVRETFTDRPAVWREELPWQWPKRVTQIGVGMAVMYRSDKWKKRGEFEDYKHLCESREPWALYAAPKFSLEGIALVGPEEAVKQADMPTSIAILAHFLGIQCRLFGPSGRSGYALPTGDDGIYQMQIRRAKLAAAKTASGSLFLTVYTDDLGPLLFLFGKELDVERDGIVG